MRFPFYEEADIRFDEMLPSLSLLNGCSPDDIRKNERVRSFHVHCPEEQLSFLHEAAVIAYHGTLFASWYHNAEHELKGRTPICGRRSHDGGKTWSDPEILIDDPTGRILNCPPVYGICDDTLYMLANEMVSADHMHALDLYRYNSQTEHFEFLWSRPLPFKLNTNVVTLANGKLLLPGRIAELDGFPNTPAVLISDSGKIDAEWRLVKIAENGALPDGSELRHPELSVIADGAKLRVFCRDDRRKVPLLYQSDDYGEHWSALFTHDIPFSSSKIYSGTLSNGRNYVIGNLYPGRSKLVLFLSDAGSDRFSDGIVLQDGYNDALGCGPRWHYPSACEADGNLYVIYSTVHKIAGREQAACGAGMSVIPIDCTAGTAL